MASAAYLERLALMIDSVSDAIVTIDSRGVIEYANRGAQELFGYRQEEMLGRNVSMLMPAPDSARHDMYIHAYVQTGQSRVMNHRRSVNGRRKDGSLVPIDLTLGQMLEHGEQKFTAVMRDVTEQRRLQQQAAEAERRLQEAKDRADEANLAKSVFLATMSHEIRTPMNGVLGSLELLGMSDLDDSQHETVAMASQSGRELLRILDDILDFSKIEAGRLELRPEITALRGKVIDAVISTFAPLAAKKGLDLHSRVDPAVADAVSTDPLRLRQILHNFVSNAVKFTLSGSVELMLDVLQAEPRQQRLRFAVRDTGIGISAANQARLFKPFVQAEGDTTRRFGGTGLGLAICRGLAASMGGILTMESAPGLGTTMSLTLTLPIADLATPTGVGTQVGEAVELATPRAITPSGIAPPTTAEAELRHTLVLVVDDHATNRKVLMRQLAALGYAAESACNGVEALAILAAGRHALLISDCQMPEMDGYTLARTIREQELAQQRPPLPIIAFTANAFASDEVRALLAGMDDYLSKPTNMDTLSAMLRRYLPAPADVAGSAAVAASAAATSAATVATAAATTKAKAAAKATAAVPTPAASAAGAPAPAALTRPQPPLDESHLAAMVAGDTAARNELLADFRLSCIADEAELDLAYQAGQPAELMQIAHRIRGASKMVGATPLAAACIAIEQACREQMTAAAGPDQLGAATLLAYASFKSQLNDLNTYLARANLHHEH